MVNLPQNLKQRGCFLLNQIYSHICAVWTSVSYLLNSETFHFKTKYFKAVRSEEISGLFPGTVFQINGCWCVPQVWKFLLLYCLCFPLEENRLCQTTERGSFPSFRRLKENWWTLFVFCVVSACGQMFFGFGFAVILTQSSLSLSSFNLQSLWDPLVILRFCIPGDHEHHLVFTRFDNYLNVTENIGVLLRKVTANTLNSEKTS